MRIFIINIVVFFMIILLLIITPSFLMTSKQYIENLLAFYKGLSIESKIKSQFKDRPELIGPIIEYKKNIQSTYHDYFVYRQSKLNSKSINIDEDGIRYSFKPNLNGDKNNFGFIFLGSSAMAGYGSNDNNTIPSYFARINNNQVVNYADYGYNSQQSLNFLTNRIITNKLEFKSGIVIAYDGGGDVDHKCRSEIKSTETAYQAIVRSSLEKSNNGPLTFNYLLQPIIEFINRIRLKIDNKPRIKLFDCQKGSLKSETTAKHLVKSWQLTKEIANANNFGFMAILQPFATKQHLNLDFSMNETKNENGVSVYDNIKKIAKNSDLVFLDLSQLFLEKGAHFFDHVHVDANGNKIIADKISEFIMNNKLEILDF